MQVSESRIDALTWHFDVAIPALEIERKVADKISELSRTMQLPGFRPGKVPATLIRKKYGLAIRGEVVEEAINTSSASVLSERGLRPAAEPQIEVTSAAEGADLSFRIAVESFPQVPEIDCSGITLERLVTEAENDSIEDTLKRLADNSAVWEPVADNRPAALGDKVTVDFCPTPDVEPASEAGGQGFDVELGGGRLIPGLEEALVGTVAGDRRSIPLASPDGQSEGEQPPVAAEITIRVRHVLQKLPAAVDDALATRLGCENVNALRTLVRDSQNAELANASRQKMKRELLDQLAGLVDFPLPRSIVEREMAAIADQLSESDSEAESEPGAAGAEDSDPPAAGGDAADAAAGDRAAAEASAPAKEEAAAPDGDALEQRALAERRVRLALLFADVAQRNSIRVGEDELAKAVVGEARRYPGREKEVFAYFKENPEAREGLSGPILEDKVVDFIIGQAQVTERRLGVEEFLAALAENAGPAADTSAEAVPADGGTVDGAPVEGDSADDSAPRPQDPPV